MTLPKRTEEVFEEHKNKNVIDYKVRHVPLHLKNGGIVPNGLVAEAFIDNTRVAAMTYMPNQDGHYEIDYVYCAPQYRGRNITIEMAKAARKVVTTVPYALMDKQTYQSEAGYHVAQKALRTIGDNGFTHLRKNANPKTASSNVKIGGPLIAEIPAVVGGVADLVGTGAATAATDTAVAGAGAAATDTAVAGAGAAATDTAGATATDTAANAASKGSMWSRLKGFAGKALAAQGGISAAQKLMPGHGGSGSTSTPTMGPYGGATGGGQPISVGRMLQASVNSEPTMQDVPKLLELILEVLCRCGAPTASKFNGMPHCLPGSGCATNLPGLQTNPKNEHCCSCGNPKAAASFNGATICAPGQGCNDHWDPESGKGNWNPLMESPDEKIADHDNWASKTNHGEFEMPHDAKITTWE